MKPEITLGKPIDILSLKLNMIEDFSSNVAKIQKSRISLFKKNNLEEVNLCPICKSKNQKSNSAR